MGITDSAEFSKEKVQALQSVRVTERALQKHIRLIKKREKIVSIVAMLERLKGDLRGAENSQDLRRHLAKLHELTSGFSTRMTQRKQPS